MKERPDLLNPLFQNISEEEVKIITELFMKLIVTAGRASVKHDIYSGTLPENGTWADPNYPMGWTTKRVEP